MDLRDHRVLAEDGDVVAPVDEAPDGAELGRHGAAAVDQGEEVLAGIGVRRAALGVGSFQDAGDLRGDGSFRLGTG